MNKLSIILVLLGILILIIGFKIKSPKVHGIKINESINKDLLPDSFQTEIDKQSNREYFSVIFISTKVCPPCINNLIDYQNLLSEINISTILIFIDDNETDIEEFVKIVSPPKPYLNITSDKLPIELYKNKNEVLLIKNSGLNIFYRIELSNTITTQIDYKKRVLKDAFKKNLFD